MANRILVVEDEDELRESVAEVFRGQGYEVSTAANGREALERLRRDKRPSVILLDLMMPVMDGWDFRRRQLDDNAVADIPVVVFTSTKDVDAEKLDAEAVLEKPVAIDRLVQVVGDIASPSE